MLLNPYSSVAGVDASVAGDARTMADSYSSSGWPFRVSFGLASPPASSTLSFSWVGAGPPGGYNCDPPKVVAVHGDCLLFELRTFETHQGNNDSTRTLDYFLYESGVAVLAPDLLYLPAVSALAVAAAQLTAGVRGDEVQVAAC